jgi:hypothetical protein
MPPSRCRRVSGQHGGAERTGHARARCFAAGIVRVTGAARSLRATAVPCRTTGGAGDRALAAEGEVDLAPSTANNSSKSWRCGEGPPPGGTYMSMGVPAGGVLAGQQDRVGVTDEPPQALTATVTVSPGSPDLLYRTLLPKSSLQDGHIPHGCPGPSTPPTNARATRACSARPASVTLSRTAAPAIAHRPCLPGWLSATAAARLPLCWRR